MYCDGERHSSVVSQKRQPDDLACEAHVAHESPHKVQLTTHVLYSQLRAGSGQSAALHGALALWPGVQVWLEAHQPQLTSAVHEAQSSCCKQVSHVSKAHRQLFGRAVEAHESVSPHQKHVSPEAAVQLAQFGWNKQLAEQLP